MRSTYCVYPCSSTEQISKSPINRSPTKQLYSFARDTRFRDPRPYCDNIYQLPSHFRRNPSRLRFSRSSSKRLPLHESPERFDNRVLGVGPTFSLRKKTKVIDKKMSIQPQNDNPGAGSYENPEALSPRGQYPTSKFPKTSLSKFNPRRSQRFLPIDNRAPGPGRYEQVNNLTDSGRYLLSQSFGAGKRFFDREHRVVKFQFTAKKDLSTSSDIKDPGPGSYRSSSEFGHYDGDVYGMTGGISYLQSPRSSRHSLRRTSRTRF